MGMCESCDRNPPIKHSTDKNHTAQNTNNKVTQIITAKEHTHNQPTLIEKPSTRIPKQKKLQPREIMQYKASLKDDYIIHHLKHELTLTNYANIKSIKTRQIAEHILLQFQLGIITGTLDADLKIANYYETLMVAWIQRTFLDIWKIAHKDLFIKQMEINTVRRKVTQQFIFQLYQLKEYVEAGLTKVCFRSKNNKFSLHNIMQFSDNALLSLFKTLKEKYPQNTQTNINQLLKIPSWPAQGIKIDLFKHFKCVSFSDPTRLNYQTIYHDVKLLLTTAIQLQQDFKNDMKDILGGDTIACVKVGLVQKDGEKHFNAYAVRRMFTKWTQNLLENCPQLYHSRAFLDFIDAKTKIINNFYFKSNIQPTTHIFVIEILSDLLQAAKYNFHDQKRRNLFIFNIYDLLRCKIKTTTVPQIVTLLQKLKNSKISKTGKKIEVVHIKNRLQTGKRDLLVNFRYGDIIIGQAQLCLDDSHVSKQAKNNHQIYHFIYQLQRSIFGPSLQIMMQYQDNHRPDTQIKFQADGLLKMRTNLQIKNIIQTNTLCFNGHKMVRIVGNLFAQAKEGQRMQDVENRTVSICCFCGRYAHANLPYDYCYKCSISFCQQCTQQYKQPQMGIHQLTVDSPAKFIQIETQQHLQKYCLAQKALIVLFWLQGSVPSESMKDCMKLQYARSMCLPIYEKPIIAMANVRLQAVKRMCQAEQITEYPTLVLYNQNKQPLRKLIGFQWFQVPMIYKIQKQLLEGRSIVVQLICSADNCRQPIKIVSKSQITAGAYCRVCYDLNNPDDLPKQYQNQAGLCAVGHYRCIGCCYASLPAPTSYKGFNGSYLSTSFEPDLVVCSARHPLMHIRYNLLGSRIYTCFSCNNKRFFDDQIGTGYCQECKEVQCPECFGYKPQKLYNNYNMSGIALHFVQSTAEESYRCGCGELFKKSYTGSITDYQDYIKICQSGVKERWKCFICNYGGQDGELHLGCYGCRGLSSVLNQKREQGTPQKLYNLQICIPCGVKSQILRKQNKRKAKQQKTNYKCPKSQHQLISTTDSLGEIIFDCDSCNHSYFANTQRYYCQGCKASFCQFNNQCKTKLLKRCMPKVQHRCPQNDPLKFKLYNDGVIALCDGCMQAIKEFAFTCVEHDYSLCQNCIDTTNPTFIGTIFKDIKESSQTERLKLMEGKIQLGIAKELDVIEMQLGISSRAQKI